MKNSVVYITYVATLHFLNRVEGIDYNPEVRLQKVIGNYLRSFQEEKIELELKAKLF